MVKNPPANAGDARGSGLIPGSGGSSGEGNGSLLQDSCLENSINRVARWGWATGHGITKSRRTWLSTLTHENSLKRLEPQNHSPYCVPNLLPWRQFQEHLRSSSRIQHHWALGFRGMNWRCDQGLSQAQHVKCCHLEAARGLSLALAFPSGVCYMLFYQMGLRQEI